MFVILFCRYQTCPSFIRSNTLSLMLFFYSQSANYSSILLVLQPSLSPLHWWSYLFLWRRSELLGLLGSEGCRHVECQHHFVVAEPLVVLEARHKVIREGHNCLDTMTHLAVAQVLQHMAHLYTHAHKLDTHNHSHNVESTTYYDEKCR